MADAAPLVYVDPRWGGAHGIGRYATEVLSRLTVAHESMPLTGSPSSPRDVFTARPVPASGLVYSPGFNASLRSPAPQVVTIHDLIHLRMPWPGRAKYRAYYDLALRPLVRRAGSVFTDSQASTDEIRAWLRDDDVEIVNAGAGCSANFRPTGAVETFARPTFVCVANLRPHKNVRVLLGALARVREADAVIVVPAAEAEGMRALAASFGVEAQVDVRSGVSDDALAAAYRGAVATVFPSTMEGFGLPALESITCGTPVIYWAGCASVAEIVGGAGVGMDSADDAEEWSEALRAQLGDRTAVPEGAGARFTWESTARTVDAHLSRLLNR